VIERAAKVLGQRLLALPRPFAQVIVGDLGSPHGWQGVPEEWQEPYDVLGWKLVCGALKSSGWSEPEGVEEVTGEIQALMVRLGAPEW